MGGCGGEGAANWTINSRKARPSLGSTVCRRGRPGSRCAGACCQPPPTHLRKGADRVQERQRVIHRRRLAALGAAPQPRIGRRLRRACGHTQWSAETGAVLFRVQGASHFCRRRRCCNSTRAASAGNNCCQHADYPAAPRPASKQALPRLLSWAHPAGRLGPPLPPPLRRRAPRCPCAGRLRRTAEPCGASTGGQSMGGHGWACERAVTTWHHSSDRPIRTCVVSFLTRSCASQTAP